MTFPKASDTPVKLEKPPFLRGLRWKITLSFVFLFFCLLAVLGMAGSTIEYAFLRSSFEQSALSEKELLIDTPVLQIDNVLELDYKNLQKDSSELLPWLSLENRNTDAIRLWLRRYDEKLKLRRKTTFSSAYLFPDDSEQEQEAAFQLKVRDENSPIMKTPLFEFVVFDDKAGVIASSGSTDPQTGEYAKEKEFAKKVLNENSSAKRELDNQDGTSLRIAFPIIDNENRVKGVLYFKDTLPFGWSEVFQKSLLGLGEQLVPNLIFFSILGFVFGSPFAWYLSKRLTKIASAAQSWRTGDFSAKTNDKSSDEVGILSRRLNEMADDLSENFALRQSIATAEERNRIARDLHDSVKQQVFGLAMQISTANALVEKNPTSAKNYLAESENLIKEIQTELVDMIHEFSLPVKEPEDFKDKIENLVKDWGRQNVMKTKIVAENRFRVSPTAAHSIYRITQETLANIARHSGATEVKIILANEPGGKLRMSVSDNGCGFDAEKVEKGFGLKSMRERAESLPNGWLRIKSETNAGTTIEIGCDARNGNGASNENK